ncbi:g4924 [Coccomyxa viridis]|uniref:G4924 protein n=1 Tax=Coccomyxa viridis TaxID=1274662 RepID=A0ABP1FU41_9CHLO
MLVATCEWMGNLLGVSPQAVSSTLVIVLIGLGALVGVYFLKQLSTKQHGQGKPSKVMLVTFLVVAYSLCSSMLLILNKVAVTYIPAPSFILFCQLASCALYVKLSAVAGVVDAEPLEWEKSKKFALIVFGFIGTLFSNVTSLRYVPVDTIICFRASCPIVIAVIEFLYLGRELPSFRSWASLLGVFAGVTAYTWQDVNFTVVGYVWIIIWYTFAVFEMVYVKKVVDTVKMTTWSRTYYQNTLAILPMLAITAFSGEVQTLMNLKWTTGGIAALVASCVGGLGMSYFSFALRAVISATSFSVIGNVCKVLTILVNLLMWDKHSNALGTVALLGCLGAGSAYQQAPMRSAHKIEKADKDPREEDPLVAKAESRV